MGCHLSRVEGKVGSVAKPGPTRPSTTASGHVFTLRLGGTPHTLGDAGFDSVKSPCWI